MIDDTTRPVEPAGSDMTDSRARRCRDRGPHEAHQWRGLNTRHAGYWCTGVSAPAQVIDLMAALKEALAKLGGTP